MKFHNWHTIGWVVIIMLFILWEVIGLANKADANQPFTYFVRKLAMIEPLWFLFAGFILWMLYHFLFKHEILKSVFN